VWKNWAKTEARIDVGKWEDALKVLGSSNGIEYVKSLGEVALRNEIVEAVRHLIPPESSWSIAHVQGRTHILKVRNICEYMKGYEGECSWTMQGVLAIACGNMVTLCRLRK